MFLLEFPLRQNILETIILIPTSRPTTISNVLVLLFVLRIVVRANSVLVFTNAKTTNESSIF